MHLQAVIYKPSGPAAQFGYNVREMHGGGVAPWKVWMPAQEMWTNPLMGCAMLRTLSDETILYVGILNSMTCIYGIMTE